MSEDELAELDEVRLELDIPRQYVSDEVGTALDGALARFDAVRARLRAAPAEGEALREERYWCGCVRHARWERCETHGHLDRDAEPPAQRHYPPCPHCRRAVCTTEGD